MVDIYNFAKSGILKFGVLPPRVNEFYLFSVSTVEDTVIGANEPLMALEEVVDIIMDLRYISQLILF